MDGSEDDVLAFFEKHFSDAMPLLPTLLDDWFSRPTSPLCTVRCSPFNHGGAGERFTSLLWASFRSCLLCSFLVGFGDAALLIGDAAHAIVPFYGQGCNSAFEDCALLDDLWDTCGGDTAAIFREFSEKRKRHVDAIGDLAIEHYHELANKVTPPMSTQVWRAWNGWVESNYIFRKLVPAYTSLYHAVSFSHDGYDDARSKGVAAEEYLGKVSAVAAAGVVAAAGLAVAASALQRRQAAI